MDTPYGPVSRPPSPSRSRHVNPMAAARARIAAMRFSSTASLWLAAILLASGVVTAAVVPIANVQGSGEASPLAGSIVTVRGVVTVLTTQGFFLQTPDGETDGDPDTSEGIYVYTGSTPSVDVGDAVEVTAEVQEFNGLTELALPDTVSVLASGSPLPTPVAFDATLPSPARPVPGSELERFEGMLVAIANGFATGPSDDDGSYQVVCGGYRAMREPGVAWPGIEGLPVWDGNPEILTVYARRSLAPTEVWSGSLVSVTGGLSEYWGHYELVPAQTVVEEAVSVSPLSASRAGELRVATWNLARLFDDLNDPGVDDTVLSSTAYELRLSKAARYVSEILARPEVLVVQEVEKLAVLSRLAELASDPSWSAPYQAFLLDGDDPGGIDVGYLVAPWLTATDVEQIGRGETFSYSGSSYRIYDRPPLVLEVEVPAPQGSWPLTLIAVHLRSLNGIEGSNGGFVRAKRKAGARWLAEWLAGVLAAEPTARLAVIGDFNAFQFTDGYVDVVGEVSGAPDPAGALLPAEDLFDPDLVDVVRLLPSDQRYSFILDGNGEALDHMIVSSTVVPYVERVEMGRGCADAPPSQAAADVPYGSSDHDALVVTLRARAPRARRGASAR